MSDAIRVALIDSGLTQSQTARVAQDRNFSPDGEGGFPPQAAFPDRLAHGSRIAEIILRQLPDIELVNGQVFTDRLSTTPKTVSAAIDWAVDQGSRIIGMSFGLKEDREILRASCQRALDHNIIIIAAAPARGEVVYPAAYEGIIRFTGDARCSEGEYSALFSRQADFGAYAWPQGFDRDNVPKGGGASFSVAWGIIAAVAVLRNNPAAIPGDIISGIEENCSYKGRETRLR